MKQYINDINTIIEKHSYSMFDVDYKLILEELINFFDTITLNLDEKDKPDYNNNFLSILFDLAIQLNNKDFTKYIKLLKKYKIYKYTTNNINKFFIKRFLKLYIIFYFLKHKKYSFFQKYINFIPKSTKLHIGLFFWKLLIWKKDSNILERLKTILPSKLYVDYMELVITTKCTLNCKNCANLMPMYNKPYNVDKEMILKTIEKLKSSIDEIYVFRILGGEPLCNPDLKYYLKDLPKEIFREIVIVTNGTLVPNDSELIKIMKEKDVIVNISNYGNYSFKKEELLTMLKNEKIRYKIDDSYRVWFDYGTLDNKNRNKKDLKKQFSNCDLHCKSILNGSIYYCPRLAHGIDLGKIKTNKGEYIDLLNNTDKENKKQIRKLMYRNNYIEACNYCNYATKECKIIPIGEQLPRKNQPV